MRFSGITKKHFVQIGAIIFLAGLAYLPFIHKFGYTFDDWYLMWSAKAYGPQVFHDVFSVDRPLRAYVMIPAYLLFGENPLWYNLSAFALRVIGALFFWRMIRILWPGALITATCMTLLFVIYPGFLSQPNAIDYLSHHMALVLVLFSLMLTIEVFAWSESGIKHWGLLLVSVVFGWLYLGLMEYYIGFELIRLLLIVLLTLRAKSSWFQAGKKAFLRWLPLSVVPFGFVFWRVFIFVGERKATDAGAQLSFFLLSPLRATWVWLTGIFHDVFQVLIFAWFVPLMQLLDKLTTSQLFIGIAIAGLAGLMGFFISFKLTDKSIPDSWRTEALWLGIFSVFAGVIPVVLANRSVEFPYFSRYTLIGSAGAVIFVVALIASLPRKKIRQSVFAVFLAMSVMTHFANSVNAANETAAMRDYWWQVAWRAPNLTEMTTIVAEYPVATLQEDYFIWGPANLIYYPYGFHEKDIQPALFAALPTQETFEQILSREPQQYYKRRNIVTYANYRNVLVILKPTPESCIRVLGPELADISRHDAEIILDVRRYSEMERILLDNPRTPPSIVFGNEPEHDWCYYYQKASLARQYGDWAKVRALGYEIREKNLAPNDEIEWLPFLQAEAVVEASDFLFEINSQMTDSFSRQQACFSLKELDVPEKNSALFCDSQ